MRDCDGMKVNKNTGDTYVKCNQSWVHGSKHGRQQANSAEVNQQDVPNSSQPTVGDNRHDHESVEASTQYTDQYQAGSSHDVDGRREPGCRLGILRIVGEIVRVEVGRVGEAIKTVVSPIPHDGVDADAEVALG